MLIPTSSTSSQHVTPFAHFTNYIDSLLLTAFRGRSQFFSMICCFYAAFVLNVPNAFPRFAASHNFSLLLTAFRGRSRLFSMIYVFYDACVLHVSNVFHVRETSPPPQ